MVVNRRIRAFIAVPLSEEVLNGLQAGQDAIRDSGVKASFPEISSVHLTLKFLGDIEPGQVSMVSAALKDRIYRFDPFVLNITGLGVFPNLSRPRIAWAGVMPDDRLQTLHGMVESAMREIGFEAERRKFSPHITLARIKSVRDGDSLGEMLKRMRNFEMGTTPVRSLRLYQSILKPEGAVHKVLAEVNCGNQENK